MKKDLNHFTQEACNNILGSSLKIDGQLGPISNKEIDNLLSKVLSVLAKKGIKLKKTALLSLRMDDKFSNQFKDWGFIFINNSIRCFPISTKPGWSYVKNKQWVDKVKGVLVIKEGFYPNLWRIGQTKWTGKNHLIQVGKVNIYRDSNLDEVFDRGQIYNVGPEVGLNFHSWLNALGVYVNNLSAGCQVVQSNVLDLIWPLITQIADENGGFIDYTVINKKEL